MREAQLSHVFSALSSPVRRAMVVQLADGAASVGEIRAQHDISLPAISKHLDVLERAGLVSRTPDGRFRHCRLHPEPMHEAMRWIREQTQFWEQSFQRLAVHLKDTDKGESTHD